MFSKTITIALSALLISSTPVFAGAVTGYTATDGFGAVPTAKGTYLLDFRLNGGFPGTSFAPVLNLVGGVTDGLEVGIGGALNFASLGTTTPKTSVESVYPWVRIALPLSTDNIKTGLMVGSLIPVYQSATPVQPGITGLMDIATGPVTTSINLGYSRTFPATISQPANTPVPSGDNIVSGNLNFTLPYSGFTFYEEQFVNYPVGGYSNGGFRLSLIFPAIFNNKLAFDINPAVLFYTATTGTSWLFSPNAGLIYTF